MPRRWGPRSSGAGSGGRTAAALRLLDLAPRFTAARDAQECVRTVVQECVRTVVEEFGGTEREDGACVLVARVTA